MRVHEPCCVPCVFPDFLKLCVVSESLQLHGGRRHSEFGFLHGEVIPSNGGNVRDRKRQVVV